tara:strand:- start:83 stop:535 length:453 start_codon:yes stop_codon:yes gene_type:complete
MIHLSSNERWMLYALKEAKKADKIDEVPIGAIIVKDDMIIGTGYNQMEILKDSTAHAEIIAITAASNKLGDWRLNSTSIYITKEPCMMCAGAIINSRIENIFYGLPDSEFGFDNLKNSLNIKMHHINNIEGGILKDECQKIIQEFFLKKR